jgi:hypothetical protein
LKCDDTRMTDRKLSPIVACTLGKDDLGAQAERWRRFRSEAGLGRTETADGLRLAFRDETEVEDELRALVAVENECCAWARWDVSREDGELVMHARSTGQGIATLHAMFSGPSRVPAS